MAADSLKIARGDMKPIVITVTVNGAVYDLTDHTVFFTAKEVIDDDVADAEAIIKRKIISHTSPTTGVTGFITTEAETAAAGVYKFDIQVINAAGTTIKSTEPATLEIYKDVTRRTS